MYLYIDLRAKQSENEVANGIVCKLHWRGASYI
jgi:hypothetical protein